MSSQPERPGRPPSVDAGDAAGDARGLRRWFRPAVAVSAVVALVGAYLLLSKTGALEILLDRNALEERIRAFGFWGPLAVVALMTLAIVFSPIPSAPIALAAGAAYGHGWGTVYVLAGAELGALVAFGVARLVGYGVLRRWFGERLDIGLLGSQGALMGIVFVSRLLPFISFDLVSYAAGLTQLTAWRFALATLAGIVPASFLLAHFGDEMASGESQRIAVTVVALGGITLLPIAVKFVIDWRHKRANKR